MKIIGVAGAIIGFILGLLLLSFAIFGLLINGVEYEERNRRTKKRTKKSKN